MCAVPIKIAGTSAVTADDIAAIDIPEDGEIVGALLNMSSDDATLGERATLELSFNSTNQLFSNDARGSLATLSDLAKGGTGVVGYASAIYLNFSADPVPVAAGERMHSHVIMSAAHTILFDIILFLKGKGGGRRSVRRR